MSKHTAGPWHPIKNTGIVASDADHCHVATVGDYADKELLPFNRDRWDADVRLVAAAPETLEALRDLVEIIDAAGLLNLSNGVPLGQTSWYVKASARLGWAKTVIDKVESIDAPRVGACPTCNWTSKGCSPGACVDEVSKSPASTAAAIIEWDRRGRLVDDESFVQNNAPLVARGLWGLIEALKQIRIELAALTPNPGDDKPDFSVACPNEADAECVASAYEAARFAVDFTAEGLDEVEEQVRAQASQPHPNP